MGGCASRPKASDMNEESVHNKLVSETIVDKENNTENNEEQNKTQVLTVETKETSPVEPTKESPVEPEVATVDVTAADTPKQPLDETKKVEEVTVNAPKVADETKKVEEKTVTEAKPEITEKSVDTNVAKPVNEEIKPVETGKEVVVAV